MDDNIVQRVAEGMTTESDARLFVGLVALGTLLGMVGAFAAIYYFS